MYIKRLDISADFGIIRSLQFRKGLNLIVDNTNEENTLSTGNSVGKTTILKLIDFCLGAKKEIVYEDPENRRRSYELVKDFLEKNNVVIELMLVDELDNPNSRSVTIRRNFLTKNRAVRQINDQNVKSSDFSKELEKIFFSEKNSEKPTFRQLISHNIRYKDESVSHTLKTLSNFTKDIEYETLYLYMFGCNYTDGGNKQFYLDKLEQEEKFKKRLEKNGDRTKYEFAIAIIEDEI